MSKLFKSLLSTTAVLSLAAAGCVARQDPPPSAIEKASPTNDQVAIHLPMSAMRMAEGSGSSPTQSPSTQPQLGQLAAFYVATRGVVATFNGGTAWVLILIHTITQFPVTSVHGNVYEWGPWSGSALDPAIYKLDVTANADGTFDYTLSGHAKSDPNPADFAAIIQGHAVPGANDGPGTGMFLIDFDAARAVDPVANANNKGQVQVDYDIPSKHLDLAITTTDANGQAVTANYTYDEATDGSAQMVFDVLANLGGTSAEEEVTLHSRWLATGAGRGDARLTGGDLGATQAIASECWNTAFDEVYYTDSVNFLPTEGDPTQCVYTDISLPPAR